MTLALAVPQASAARVRRRAGGRTAAVVDAVLLLLPHPVLMLTAKSPAPASAITFPVFDLNSFKSDLFRQPGSSFLNFYAIY